MLDAHRRSGEAIAAFARANGIAASRLYWWKKRLSPSVAPISTMTLVPAVIVADDGAAVVIRLPGGIEIEATSATPSWVAAVVTALVSPAP